MTLSNAAEIVFLTATVPMLLRVNHERDGRPAGRPDSDDGNMGKATFGCVSPKKERKCTQKKKYYCSKFREVLLIFMMRALMFHLSFSKSTKQTRESLDISYLDLVNISVYRHHGPRTTD